MPLRLTEAEARKLGIGGPSVSVVDTITPIRLPPGSIQEPGQVDRGGLRPIMGMLFLIAAFFLTLGFAIGVWVADHLR